MLAESAEPEAHDKVLGNRPRSIYQYSNMAPRLSGQTSIFGVVFFVSKSLLGIERQKKLEKFAILTRKPRSHARILIYRTWQIPGQIDWNMEMLVFEERGKPEYPAKNLSEQRREPTKNSTHI